MKLKYNGNKPHRKSTRLKDYDYSKPGAYFITICTDMRKCIFGRIEKGKMILNEFGQTAKTELLKMEQNKDNIRLDEYSIMPNHIHCIIMIIEVSGIRSSDNVGAIHELPLRIKRRKMLIPKIIGSFKMKTGKLINQIRNSPGNKAWQRGYYDRIIRMKVR